MVLKKMLVVLALVLVLSGCDWRDCIRRDHYQPPTEIEQPIRCTKLGGCEVVYTT